MRMAAGMKDLNKEIVRRALLLDYYGPLLTEKQRQIYDLYYQEDLSLGEISSLQKVSRNAVYDLILRTDEKLERYEEALGLIRSGEAQAAAKALLAKRFSDWGKQAAAGLTKEETEELAALLREIQAL